MRLTLCCRWDPSQTENRMRRSSSKYTVYKYPTPYAESDRTGAEGTYGTIETRARGVRSLLCAVFRPTTLVLVRVPFVVSPLPYFRESVAAPGLEKDPNAIDNVANRYSFSSLLSSSLSSSSDGRRQSPVMRRVPHADRIGGGCLGVRFLLS